MVLLKIAIMALMAIGKRIMITAMVCEEGAADVGPNYPRGQGLKSSYRLRWVGENETRSSWWSKSCMTLPQWVRQLLRPLSRMGDRCLPPHPPLQCWHTGGGAGPAMQNFFHSRGPSQH